MVNQASAVIDYFCSYIVNLKINKKKGWLTNEK